MKKGTICRGVLSATFLLALYPMTFCWFTHGGEAEWSGNFFIDTIFSVFLLAYYIGVWAARSHPARMQLILHVIWLLLYIWMFVAFPMKSGLDKTINLSISMQSVCTGFYTAFVAVVIHMIFALLCSWGGLRNLHSSET